LLCLPYKHCSYQWSTITLKKHKQNYSVRSEGKTGRQEKKCENTNSSIKYGRLAKAQKWRHRVDHLIPWFRWHL